MALEGERGPDPGPGTGACSENCRTIASTAATEAEEEEAEEEEEEEEAREEEEEDPSSPRAASRRVMTGLPTSRRSCPSGLKKEAGRDPGTALQMLRTVDLNGTKLAHPSGCFTDTPIAAKLQVPLSVTAPTALRANESIMGPNNGCLSAAILMC